jgi:hypothetical protein
MKLSIEDLKVDSYATQLSEQEVTEFKGGTTYHCGTIYHCAIMLNAMAMVATAYLKTKGLQP